MGLSFSKTRRASPATSAAALRSGSPALPPKKLPGAGAASGAPAKHATHLRRPRWLAAEDRLLFLIARAPRFSWLWDSLSDKFASKELPSRSGGAYAVRWKHIRQKDGIGKIAPWTIMDDGRLLALGDLYAPGSVNWSAEARRFPSRSSIELSQRLDHLRDCGFKWSRSDRGKLVRKVRADLVSEGLKAEDAWADEGISSSSSSADRLEAPEDRTGHTDSAFPSIRSKHLSSDRGLDSASVGSSIRRAFPRPPLPRDSHFARFPRPFRPSTLPTPTRQPQPATPSPPALQQTPGSRRSFATHAKQSLTSLTSQRVRCYSVASRALRV